MAFYIIVQGHNWGLKPKLGGRGTWQKIQAGCQILLHIYHKGIKVNDPAGLVIGGLASTLQMAVCK